MTARQPHTNARLDVLGRVITPRAMSAVSVWARRQAPGDWVRGAACRETDPEWFFPEYGPRVPRQVYGPALARAKAVCQSCPVIKACLEHALAQDEAGIWGGMTENERDELRTRRKR